MNYKARIKNNGRNGGSFNDEFFIRFKGVPFHLAKKIIKQEKNYRKQQLLIKRRKSDHQESKHQSNLSNDLSAPGNAGVIL
jgi:hypothetical protein